MTQGTQGLQPNSVRVQYPLPSKIASTVNSALPSWTDPSVVATRYSRKLRRIRPLGDWAVDGLPASDRWVSQWIEVCGEVEVNGKGRVTVHGPILRMDGFLYEYLISRLMKGDELTLVSRLTALAFEMLLSGNRAFLLPRPLSTGFRAWLMTHANHMTTADPVRLEGQLSQLEEGLLAYGPTRSAGELFADLTARIDQIREYASDLDSRLEVLSVLAGERAA